MKLDCKLFNYADDNHLCYDSKNVIELKKTLETDTAKAIAWCLYNYMDVNPNKFQTLVLDRKRDTSFSLSVQNNIILPNKYVNVLGVTLDNCLKLDVHVTNICKKASRQINALRRIRRFLNEKSRILVYKSFIASNFNYCPLSYIFCDKKSIRKLEKLQERALRIVFTDENASYEDLLKRGNFLPLSALRFKHLAIELFKCIHGQNPRYLNDLFQEQSNDYDMRSINRLKQPKFYTYKYGFRSFRYYGAKFWNMLPNQVKCANDLNEFKRNITKWCYTNDFNNFEISF